MRNYVFKVSSTYFVNLYNAATPAAGSPANFKPHWGLMFPAADLPKALHVPLDRQIEAAFAQDEGLPQYGMIYARSAVPPVVVDHPDTSGDSLGHYLDLAGYMNIPRDFLLNGLPMMLNITMIEIPRAAHKSLVIHAVGINPKDVGDKIRDIREAALKRVDDDE